MKSKELAMLITIGLLLTMNIRLENIQPKEYSPLPSVLVSAGDPATCLGQWEDAAQTVITSSKEGSYRVRVRVQLKSAEGEEEGHAAFVVNRKSWIDGGDGWLYYRDTLEKDDMADPICLQGYTDQLGTQKQIYAALVCDWMPVEKSTG